MNSREIATKDSYDEFLQFSRITPENWLAPDRKNYVPFGVTQHEWIDLFLEPRLNAAVPRDIIRVFELARGAMIYSWFFYPLATLGSEQCTRIAEFAARERCRALPAKPLDFCKDVASLVAAGVISKQQEPRWQALRQLRNDRSHLERFMLLDPGQAVDFLRTTAELINSLFPSSNTASK